MIYGVDYSYNWPGIPAIQQSTDPHREFVVRYLMGTTSAAYGSKNLTPTEAAELQAAGIDIVCVHQITKTDLITGGFDHGVALATAAEAQLQWCGGPPKAVIYFAADSDPWTWTAEHWLSFRANLMGIASVLGLRRTGLYGGAWALEYARENALASWFWQALGWRKDSTGTLVWWPWAHMHQYQNGVLFGNGEVDYDRGLVENIGQWRLAEHDMELWYPRATVYTANRSGLAFVGAPYRGVLHTTEGKTAAGAFGVFKNQGFWPQFTASYETGTFQIWQHLPLNVGGYALRNESGGVETNTENAIQIELVGTANTSLRSWGPQYVEDFPPGYLAGIAAWMRWVEAQTGIRRMAVQRWLSYPASYGLSNGIRMSMDAWRGFNGWCGHEHVPENLHGDPGLININALIGTTGGDWFDMATQADLEAAIRKVFHLSAAGMQVPVGQLNNDGALKQLIGMAQSNVNLVNAIKAAVAGLADDEAKIIAAVEALSLGGVDVGRLASEIVLRLGPEMAAAVATELAKRLAA